VAHEVNNPINLIMFNVPLLEKIWHDVQPVLEERAVKEPGKKYGGLTYGFLKGNVGQLLLDMRLACDRIANIVSALKRFARQTHVADKQPVNINDAIRNASRLAQSTIVKSGIDLTLDLEENLPGLQGNLQNIEQIVLNLALNAVQAIDHDKGEIKIATRYNKKKGEVLVSVSDNGRGISPSVRDRVFDPFVTDRQAEGGTGLGLSVTYSLVKGHSGDVSFLSQEGKGTTFTVAFPTEVKEKGAKVLIVDDEKQIRDALSEALTRDRPYQVEAAGNGTEALIKFGTYRPDLLILDVFMPQMDGVRVCQTIKNEPELSGMKVIIMTGFPDRPKLKEIVDLGFVNIIEKPFDLHDFIKRVDDMLKS